MNHQQEMYLQQDLYKELNKEISLADCHFDESNFPTTGGEDKELNREISWNELSLFHFDPRTNLCEQEVQRIIHLQSLANNLPDAFTDLKRVTKSYIPAANAPERIDVQHGQPSTANP